MSLLEILGAIVVVVLVLAAVAYQFGLLRIEAGFVDSEAQK